MMLRRKDRTIRPMVVPIAGKIEPSARWLFPSAERSNHPPDGYSHRRKDRTIRLMVIPIAGKIEPSARWLFPSPKHRSHDRETKSHTSDEGLWNRLAGGQKP